MHGPEENGHGTVNGANGADVTDGVNGFNGANGTNGAHQPAVDYTQIPGPLGLASASLEGKVALVTGAGECDPKPSGFFYRVS